MFASKVITIFTAVSFGFSAFAAPISVPKPIVASRDDVATSSIATVFSTLSTTVSPILTQISTSSLFPFFDPTCSLYPFSNCSPKPNRGRRVRAYWSIRPAQRIVIRLRRLFDRSPRASRCRHPSPSWRPNRRTQRQGSCRSHRRSP
jgi:hypothetical protein